jgi:hypothetical protein
VLKENAASRDGQTNNSSAIHPMLPTTLFAGILKNKYPEKDDNGVVVFNDIAFSYSSGYQLENTGKYKTKRIYSVTPCLI